MSLLKRLSGPKIPQNAKVIAGFEGRIDDTTGPRGLAVVGDAVPGESTTILSRIQLPDGATLADRLKQESIREMDEWIRAEGDDPIPRAILRLLAASADRGERLGDQKSIVLFWQPGRPQTALGTARRRLPRSPEFRLS